MLASITSTSSAPLVLPPPPDVPQVSQLTQIALLILQSLQATLNIVLISIPILFVCQHLTFKNAFASFMAASFFSAITTLFHYTLSRN
jgi:hypothetical protein